MGSQEPVRKAAEISKTEARAAKAEAEVKAVKQEFEVRERWDWGVLSIELVKLFLRLIKFAGVVFQCLSVWCLFLALGPEDMQRFLSEANKLALAEAEKQHLSRL